MARALCPTPQKQFFYTKAEAKQRMKADAAYFSKFAHKIYVYHCLCGGYHYSKSSRGVETRPPLNSLVYMDRFKALLRK